MWQLGEIQLPQVMDVPADRSIGGRRIPGLTQDPYDSAYDDDAVYAASDDPRLDPMFPEHPLTIIRAALLRARESWVSETQPRSHGFDATGPASPGPREMLSLSALREIYWSAGRNDLLEGELTAAISSVDTRGDSADPGVARLLTMLGVVQHNSRNFLNARVTLVRARDILTTAAGAGHRETGVALALLGRTQATLCLLAEAEQSFRRAIAILEKAPDGGLPLLNAIAPFGEMLASQKRVDEAIPLIERAKRLLANRPSGGGPALLREIVGDPPPAVNARIKVVR
jgi:tetratricopeptide (TPR) repeat protein